MKKKLTFTIFVHMLLIFCWGAFSYGGILLEDQKYFNLLSISSILAIELMIFVALSSHDEGGLAGFVLAHLPFLGLAFLASDLARTYFLPILALVLGFLGVFAYRKIDLGLVKNISFLPVSREASGVFTLIIFLFVTLILFLFDLSGLQINIVIHLIFFVFELSFLFFMLERERSYEKMTRFFEISGYVAKEREEFARIIHDDILQDLYAVRNYLALMKPDLTRASGLVANLEGRLRSLMNFYRNEIFEDARPYENLEMVLDSIKALYPGKDYRENISISGAGERALKDRDLLRTSLIVCKELINNVYKHSQASYISILIDADQDSLFIRLESDGARPEDLEKIKESKGGVLLLRALIESKGNRISYDVRDDVLETEILLAIGR